MRRPFAKFFADRGTHLAAMIAYFALLSFVPLLFLTLSLLGLTGRADESSYVVHELKRALPHTSVSSIVGAVQEIQDSATTLGIAGVVVLAWTSLSLFGVLESASNIVYGRPNRSFLRGKSLALGFLSLVLMAGWGRRRVRWCRISSPLGVTGMGMSAGRRPTPCKRSTRRLLPIGNRVGDESRLRLSGRSLSRKQLNRVRRTTPTRCR